MNEIELNIFTCCDDNYIDFIPLFVVSNLYHIENCFVEVGIKTNDLNSIKKTELLLNTVCPNKFLIHRLDNEFGFSTSTIRFIKEPITKSKYVYISDIDIVTLDSTIVSTHLNIMEKHNLPYSNIIRDNTNGYRLTGLHFTPYENYYPIQDYTDLNYLLNHDEVFLYHLMQKRFPDVKNNNKLRPVHGIHMSPNRDPLHEKLGWGLNRLNYDGTNRKEAWKKFEKSYEFKSIYPHLSERLMENISIINRYYDEV